MAPLGFEFGYKPRVIRVYPCIRDIRVVPKVEGCSLSKEALFDSLESQRSPFAVGVPEG